MCKMEYKKNQKIRFYDVRGFINTGCIKAIIRWDEKIYYKVYANNFIYEITEKEIVEILN